MRLELIEEALWELTYEINSLSEMFDVRVKVFKDLSAMYNERYTTPNKIGYDTQEFLLPCVKGAINDNSFTFRLSSRKIDEPIDFEQNVEILDE